MEFGAAVHKSENNTYMTPTSAKMVKQASFLQ
jgi:hypothetical protein